jgi:hypothetical protein
MMKRFTFRVLLLTALPGINCLSAAAQCAMCRATVQGDAKAAAAAAQTLNLAVLVLLVPPALIFCALFILLVRYRKAWDERQGGGLNGVGGLWVKE